MKRPGFSLVELLVATALSAVLMAAVLAILGGVARDRRRLTAAQNVPSPLNIVERFQWDLTNARTLSQSPGSGSLVLVGHGGIDHATLAPDGRLARVAYRLYRDGSSSCLVREQQYLDDPVGAKPWRELLAIGATGFRVVAQSTEAPASDDPDLSSPAAGAPVTGQRGAPVLVPERVRLQIALPSGNVDQELWVR